MYYVGKINRKWTHYRLTPMFIVLYLFLYIYAPPVFPVSLRVFMDIINILFWITYTLKHRIIMVSPYACRFILLFVPFFAYVALNFVGFMIFDRNYEMWTYEVNHYASTVYTSVAIPVRMYFLSFFLGWLKKHMGLSFDEFVSLYFFAGLLQLVFVLFAFVSPEFRELSLSLIVEHGNEHRALGVFRSTDRRCYGFADNLWDAFGYTSALLSVIPIVRGVYRDNLKYVISFFLLCIIPLLNTRTGLILNMMTLMVSIIFFWRKKFVKYIAGIPVLLAVIIPLFLEFSGSVPESSKKWMMEGMQEVLILLTEQRLTGIFYIFYIKHLNFPSEIIFGEGTQPAVLGIQVSDIGYVIGTWLYGIIGMILVLIAFGIMFYRIFRIAKRRGDIEMQCYTLCVSSIFFVYPIKSYSLSNIAAYAILVPIFLAYLHSDQELCKE